MTRLMTLLFTVLLALGVAGVVSADEIGTYYNDIPAQAEMFDGLVMGDHEAPAPDATFGGEGLADVDLTEVPGNV
ncbi:MAG TPA: hypothetical protein VIW02_00285 [Gammaproteobacteria bacterium]